MEENQLVPVLEGEIGDIKTLVVNARDLYTFLGVGKNFTDWLKVRVRQYGFEEGRGFIPVWGKSSGGRPSAEYTLTLDMAKEPFVQDT